MTRSIIVALVTLASLARAQDTAPPHLRTRWAAQVSADHPLPEYPRPQMVRAKWQNLNGRWDYAIRDSGAARPTTFDGRIVVPFPIESQLSGVRRAVSETQRLWYHRTFRAPSVARGERLLLHFGAVDWECDVFVNGKQVATHRGGYDPFTVDITDALGPLGTDQELVVRVADPTDAGDQPRGKQVRRPRSIWYTAVTGIWQTVWLETVPSAYVDALEITPDLDGRVVRVKANVVGAPPGATMRVSALEGTRVVADARGSVGEEVVVRLRNVRPWSPASPFLYGLRVRLSTGDVVESYVGMRKISLLRDSTGALRLALNNKPLFEFGLLDQGWWPDGLYTAPTDVALRSDIETMKRLGFNLARKHVKVEPDRWYYHCDRLGFLVWQDMPSAENKTPEGRADFEAELSRMIDALRNHPSIVMWVPFNEGWGQHDTERYVAFVHEKDPSRLVNNASGWTDKHVGDVSDLHSYPGPALPLPDSTRALVLGEFGGLGLPLPGHTWLDRSNWGYRSFTNLNQLGDAYRGLIQRLRPMIADGLAASIYTQTTDVEIEVNGMMTYDRGVVKLPADASTLHAALIASPPMLRVILPTSRSGAGETWHYTTQAPAANWAQPGFDDSSWSSGPAGFGSNAVENGRVRTSWTSPDLWIRRTFEISGAPPVHPYLVIHHDEDAEIYVNGVRVDSLGGYTNGYTYVPLDSSAVRALRSGTNTIAVHVRNTRGEQYVDVGITEVTDRIRR
jgi:glycosyl hydrolase family 2